MARPRFDSPLLSLPATAANCAAAMLVPSFALETEAQSCGFFPVAGIDEAGRGPLAGPVVAAAVILDPAVVPQGIDDSKRLSPVDRERLFAEIMATAHSVSIASVAAAWIDARDIRKATLEATALCLVDGRDVPPGLNCEAVALVKGDQRSYSVGAASIVAKVARDRMMARCGAVHPAHGFAVHMGYGTAQHRAAIEVNGPVARLHRMSFGMLRVTA
jgi:ribonuclease HII